MFKPTVGKCVDCGAEIMRRSAVVKRCVACQTKRNEAKRAEYRVRQHEEKLAKIRAKSDRIREKNHPSNPDTGTNHPCPYCGKVTRTRYCKCCHSQGFDNVHIVFGTTNGWDRKAAKRVPIVSGWRGTHCIGAFSSVGRFHI